MKHIALWIRRYWPILTLILFEILLFITNYTPHTYVVGWDNMYPELNFGLNLKRAFFGIWQEYRGLGLEDGLSHIAQLPHYLFLWILSLAFPQNLLRYIFIFLTHLIGGIGAYWLFIRLIAKKKESVVTQSAGLAVSLFYLYNFATIQMYYLPFEVFMVHFALLPWLLWACMEFLENGSKKILILFAVLSLIATPQAHVPTVFLVYIFAVSTILLAHILTYRTALALKRVAVVIAVTFCMNAFWGLPFTQSAITHATEIANSKNNQMASEDIYLKNQKYGNFTNTALMRSFSLDYVQYDYTVDAQSYMFLPWTSHISQPVTVVISWIFFAAAIAGGCIIFLRRRRSWYGFVALFILSIFMIGNNIPGVGLLMQTLRTGIPLFASVFRFVFTKFFTVYALSYSVLIGIALLEICAFLARTNKHTAVILTALFIAAIGWYTAPSFYGNFFYKNLRVAIPQDYFDTFRFFGQQDPTQRVLILPAPWFWAWTQYNWDVIGSGFQWFGIPQPIVDRAFDPWSKTNENLYWELSQAIYTNQAGRLSAVLKKYNISWILFDGHIINAGYPRGEYSDEIKQMLTLLNIEPSVTYGKISLYHIPAPKNDRFVSLLPQLPNVGPSYGYNDNDIAYKYISDYVTIAQKQFDIYFPFRSLFTGRSQKELSFSVQDNTQSYTLSNTIPNIQTTAMLSVPAISASELQSINKQTGRPQTATMPAVMVNNMPVVYTASGTETMQLQPNPSASLSVIIPKIKEYLSYDSRGVTDFSAEPKSCDGYNTGLFQRDNQTDTSGPYTRFTSVDSSNCVTIPLPDMTQKSGYLVIVTQRHKAGKTLSLSVVNSDSRRAFLETQIDTPASNDFTKAYFVLPPMDTYGLGYTITIDNVSIGNQQTVNDLARIEVYQLPYDYLTNIMVTNPKTVPVQGGPANMHIIVSHPNPVWYSVELNSTNAEPSTLILSQSYDSGWIAVSPTSQFPYFKSVGTHVKVDNWKNGWTINSGQSGTIYIIFWPQILEFIGFILLPIPFIFAKRLTS